MSFETIKWLIVALVLIWIGSRAWMRNRKTPTRETLLEFPLNIESPTLECVGRNLGRMDGRIWQRRASRLGVTEEEAKASFEECLIRGRMEKFGLTREEAVARTRNRAPLFLVTKKTPPERPVFQCPPIHDISRYSQEGSPIPRELLAHFVSCGRCLALLTDADQAGE